MTRHCANCGKVLPRTSATQRKYCNTRCQVADWRKRKAEEAKAAEDDQAPKEN